jgi:two-component system nitrate/nitrite response regulator NarL
MTPLNIYIVDDHQMVIDGIRMMLAGVPGIYVSGESNGAAHALAAFEQQQPDIVISDVSMPDISGIVFAREIKRRFPGVKILILSMFDNAHILHELRACGIEGYILKHKGREELLRALYALAEGEAYFTEELHSYLNPATGRTGDTPVNMLTAREREIVKLISSGFSSAEIAKQLFISEHTVETHRRNIYRKTSTHSAIELINLVREQNLLL